MLQHRHVIGVASVVLAAALAGCGGGSQSQAPSPAPTATTVIQGEQNALPLAVAAAIPAGLKCGKPDIVWVNMHRKSFHDPGDPWYGKTKNGMYMCRADAVAAGDHPAGQRHSHMNSGNGSDMNTATAAPAETATPSGRRHHRRNGSN